VPFIHGISAGVPEKPALPERLLPIAAVTRGSSGSDSIADERDGDFETGDDFAVTGIDGDTAHLSSGGLTFAGFVLGGKQSSALRRSISFRVEKGQYDVRLRRLTPDPADDNTFNDTQWTALRTLRHQNPVRMTGLAMTAVRIRATDQMNGVIDRFNGVVESILPDWNGTNWVEQPTSNPAALFRHILQGRGNARPLSDSRIDLDRIEEWHETCATQNRQFNAVIDYNVSVHDILRDVASSGRASPGIRDGKWTVIEDRPQTVPVQHFTPHNTYGFQGRKAFDELPQALRVRFINRHKGWLQDERLVYDDNASADTATNYDTLELTGITDPDQAWREGRYHIATARLRPESYSFFCDIEHIVCTRGDLVRLTHDVPMFGLTSGRVQGVTADGGNITALRLDNAVAMAADKNYTLRLRAGDGSTSVHSITTAAGTTRDLTLSHPVTTGSIGIGDLAMFGEAGSESVALIVTSIEPRQDLSARITCVDASPAVHTADSGIIPAFSSQITLPPEMQRPPAPVVAEVQSGAETLIKSTDGSLTTRIVITLAPPAFSLPLSVRAEIRAKDETLYRPADILAESGNRLSIANVEEDEIYDIRLRYATAAGMMSPVTPVTGHRVTGASGVPADVSGFSLSVLGDTAHVSWQANADIDLSHYVLKFSPLLSDALWSGSTDLVQVISRDATAISVPAMTGSYLIKAVDTGGRQSADAAVASVMTASLDNYNAVIGIVAEEDNFPGVLDGIDRADGVLRLASMADMDGFDDMDGVDDMDIGGAPLAAAGVYTLAGHYDLGAVHTSRLTAQIGVEGLDLNATTDTWGALDTVEDFDQDTDPSLWSLSLEISTTTGDPEEDPAWSAWAPFIAGDYAARAFRFQLRMTSQEGYITPVLTALSIMIDMPDRVISGHGMLSDAGGSSVYFDRPFRAAPAIAITAYDMAGGEYYAVTGATAAGFSIRFFTAGHAGIARQFDYIAQGYGDAH
jgi:hypothetical protein